MNNKNHTVRALLHNQSFRRMVNGKASDEEIRRWNDWIERSEANRENARKAMGLIAGFQFSDSAERQVDVEEEWNRFYSNSIKKQESLVPKRRTRHTTLKWVYRLAIILAIGMLMGIGYYAGFPLEESPTHLKKVTEKHTVTTKDGERKILNFSNGSRIVLNSNTRIIYSIVSEQEQSINVVIEGEAFFEAESGGKSDSGKYVFAINTPDGVIKDIGTEFLVAVKDDRSRVVLDEGGVQINRANQNDEDHPVTMQAGEMVEFNKSKVLRRKNVNSSFYTSWATGYIEFDNTRISEVADFIEKRYGVEVRILEQSMAEIKMDGGVYFKSLADLIRSVSKVADIRVYQSKNRDTIYIGDN